MAKTQWKRQPAVHCLKHDTSYEQGAMCYLCDKEFTEAVGNMEIHDADVAWPIQRTAGRVSTLDSVLSLSRC